MKEFREGSRLSSAPHAYARENALRREPQFRLRVWARADTGPRSVGGEDVARHAPPTGILSI